MLTRNFLLSINLIVVSILATLSNAFSTLYVSPSGEGTTQKECNEIDIKVREDKRLVGLKIHQNGVKLVDSLVA